MKVIDIYIGLDTELNLMGLKPSTYSSVNIVMEDGNTIKVDYIETSKFTLNKLTKTLKENLLNIVNEIYNEHNKLIILGSAYPIYKITYNLIDGEGFIICDLYKFNLTSGKIGTYRIKGFVNNFWVGSVQQELPTELIITGPVRFIEFTVAPKFKITGIEFLKTLTDQLITVVNYNIKNTSNKTLELRNLEKINLINIEIYGIEHIEFKEECTVIDIPFCIITGIKTLKTIKLNSKIKTIEGIPIKNYLRQTDYGEYYININKPSNKECEDTNDRIVIIE